MFEKIRICLQAYFFGLSGGTATVECLDALKNVDLVEKRIKELEFENSQLKSAQQFGFDLKNIITGYYAGGIVPVACKDHSKCDAATLLTNMQRENSRFKAYINELKENAGSMVRCSECDKIKIIATLEARAKELEEKLTNLSETELVKKYREMCLNAQESASKHIDKLAVAIDENERLKKELAETQVRLKEFHGFWISKESVEDLEKSHEKIKIRLERVRKALEENLVI